MALSRKSAVFFLLPAAILFFAAALFFIASDPVAQEKSADGQSKLLVVWTSGDKEVAMKMVYMYTFNAKKQGWFDEVRFLIWGPSVKLLIEDAELQEYLKKMHDAGVELQACIACSNMYGATDKLREFGVEVKGMGKPLTDMLKSGWTTLTF